MSDSHRFVSPSEVRIGAGSADQVGDLMATRGTSALVVATAGVFDRYGDRVVGHLQEAGLETAVYDEVDPDPTVANVDAAYERYRKANCDCIVTVGGGSPIDTGKATGVLATNGGEIREYAVDRAGYEGVPEPIPPMCAVNTTAGTGSEATRSIVVTDESTATKFLVVSTEAVPAVAVEDPTLTATLPPSHTAFTGIDALTHAIEAYVSVHAWSMSDTLARAAIERVARWLPVAWANGDDLRAREEMLIGQFQAGQAFTNASVALAHGMARPFGAQLHVPHGLANGILLPYVMSFSTMGRPGRYADIARLLDAADEDTPDRDAARAGVDTVADLCEQIQLYGYLEEFATVPDRETYANFVPEMAADAVASGSPDNNPRKPSTDEIEALYLEVYDDVLADVA